jgi:Protein of unknown function (DUF2922).
MADKSLVMTFLNAEGSRTNITIPAVKDDVTEAEVGAAMDAVIVANVFESSGGDLKSKQGAQITERNVTLLNVK